MNWVKDLPNLSQVRIPHCVNYFPGGGIYSLHTFCDGSNYSYAAAVFLRREYKNVVEIHLLQAKARVAPLKQITITRLELLACCIGGRLAHSVREAMNMAEINCCFWTDSTMALSWIQNNEQLSVFVRNRVKNIRVNQHQRLEICTWLHEPS
ncbi:uncharacterized protein [Halyomorpha halys]|uniref:uncharacterized protein n=1 Tax=Halyomorpha halys TaxID=286706 RepID=UPI0006D4E7C7|nr:uncharacterized protein LOC106679857 [Halyomorpha halys]